MIDVISSARFSALVVEEGRQLFEEDRDSSQLVQPTEGWSFRPMVRWGEENDLPYKTISLIRKDEVLSQNMLFNQLSCYSGGIRVESIDGEPLDEFSPVSTFFRYNRLIPYWLEQVADIKHWFFSVSVFILSKDAKEIVSVRHKEACYCRFETVNPSSGRIEHVFFANWEKTDLKKEEIEVISVLDSRNPLGDLEVRVGLVPDYNGDISDSGERKFAVLNMFPSVSNVYYRFAPYWGVFNSGWYDIKRMIPLAKKNKFKNGFAVKYIVHIAPEYRERLMREEGISDPVKQAERWKREKENISNFLHGIENSGTTWVTGKYFSPSSGKEEPLVTVSSVNVGKEGGEWIEDTEEASNMMCFALGVHPSLIGATPGKSSGSFSGTDKRELFTMKQALEKPFHDLLLEPFRLIREYNMIHGRDEKTRQSWSSVRFVVPMMMLTTLDKGGDAKEVISSK